MGTIVERAAIIPDPFCCITLSAFLARTSLFMCVIKLLFKSRGAGSLPLRTLENKLLMVANNDFFAFLSISLRLFPGLIKS